MRTGLLLLLVSFLLVGCVQSAPPAPSSPPIASPIVAPSFMPLLPSPLPYATFVATTTASSSEAPQPEDSLVLQCTQSFDECVGVLTTKYPSTSVSVVKVEEFSDVASANAFHETWKGPFQPPLYLEMKPASEFGTYWTSENLQQMMPVVLFFIRMTGPTGQTPYVVGCGKNGELADFYKAGLLCG